MEDVKDTTFAEVAGEHGEAAKSLEEHIKSMSSEELLALDAELRSLMAHPGWGKLEELVELQRASIERGATRRLWKHLSSGHALREQGPFIRLGGVVDGLARPEKIIGKVHRTAKAVRQQLGIDGEG